MDKLIKHLEFLQLSSDKTCQYFTGKEINTIQFFCLGLLRRIDDTTTSTKVLFELLPINNKHDFSIGIMFRALVLDTLISMNLYKLIKDLKADKKSPEETEEAIKVFCNTFLSDGLNTTLNHIQDAETFDMKTPAETAQAFKNMGHLYKSFFDNYPDDGTRPNLKIKEISNAKKLFQNLAKSNELKEISKVYDIYAYFSKYDHFGIIYFTAINEPLSIKLKIYKNVIEIFIAHHALIHEILSEFSSNDTFINEQKRLANQYLMSSLNKENCK